jgi:hypothetical protein
VAKSYFSVSLFLSAAASLTYMADLLVEAVYNYRATRPDEFDFLAGDTIAVYATPTGPFWVGQNEQARMPSAGRLFPWKLVAPK